MKRIILVTLLLVILTACTNTANSANIPKETVQPDTSYDDNYSPNPQVTDDRGLLEVGQSFLDEKGEATLKAMNFVNDTYEVGPIKLTVRDIKRIHLRPDYSLIDYFHVLTHDEEFEFIKVFVEIENTSTETVNFAPIALLETSLGEKFDWEKDIYLDGLNGEIEGNTSKKGNLGFILESSEDIEWIQFITSDVYGRNEDKINESQKIKVEF